MPSPAKPHAALVPWAAAGGYAEPRKRALRHAILARNPHNRQPWIVDPFRIGAADMNADPDGIDLTGPVLETLRLTGSFNRENALVRDCIGCRSGLDMVVANAMTAIGRLGPDLARMAEAIAPERIEVLMPDLQVVRAYLDEHRP